MKLSSVILLVTGILLLTAMYASNILLKTEYNKIDKSNLYWTYGKILEQPFKHLKIEGGNITKIAFEPALKSYVGVSKNWLGYAMHTVRAFVKNDTLFLNFPNVYKNAGEKRYMSFQTPVRIFSPELLSVDGFDTNFEMSKVKQRSLRVQLGGRSKFELESYVHNLDSLHITQSDSSVVVFEMSPDLLGTSAGVPDAEASAETGKVRSESMSLNGGQTILVDQPKIKSWEAMMIGAVDARVSGVSLLDLGHAQIGSLKLNVSDSSGVILSGSSLKKIQNK